MCRSFPGDTAFGDQASTEGQPLGDRDRTLLLLALQTDLRVSELIALRCQDVVLDTGAHVRCTGKGRKTRCIPLRKEVVAALRLWLRERKGQPAEAVFTNARGQPLSRDGVQYILTQHVNTARTKCPSLKTKPVFRHSTAMSLLQHGVDRSVIALWLGHESMDTTQIYLHANLELKEKALVENGAVPNPATPLSSARPASGLSASALRMPNQR